LGREQSAESGADDDDARARQSVTCRVASG
jgi:hypothetical protein